MTSTATATLRASVLAFYVREDDAGEELATSCEMHAETARDLRGIVAMLRRGEGFVRCTVTGSPALIDAAGVEAADVRVVDVATYHRARRSAHA